MPVAQNHNGCLVPILGHAQHSLEHSCVLAGGEGEQEVLCARLMAHRKLCATLQSCASSAEAQLVCLQVVGRTHQMLDVVSPRTYIGSGKVEEIVGAVAELQADTLIFDDELTPGQLRNLEKACALQGNRIGPWSSLPWPLTVLWGWSRLGIWAAAGYTCLPEAWQPANQELQQQAATLLSPLWCVARVAGMADTS